uniref:Uncharacterized protein n=1 Tax=viral metagenome TaxID=1070528 RepID=A0A6M3M9J1_9ZZZZ
MMSRETIVSSFLAEMPMEAALVYSELGARVLLGGKPYAEWNPDTESWELYADGGTPPESSEQGRSDASIYLL